MTQAGVGAFVATPQKLIFPPSAGAGLASNSSYGLIHRALARVLSGSQDATALFVGDSHTGAATNINSGGPGYLPGIAALLSAAGIPARQGLVAPSSFAGNFDARWNVGAGWAYNGAAGFGFGGVGTFWQGTNGASANTLKFTPGVECDTFDVWYAGFNGGGTVQANIDGGANTPIVTQNAVPNLAKVTLTAGPGIGHVLQLGAITVGNVQIFAVEARLSTQATLRLGQAGANGASTSKWVTIPGISAWGPMPCIQALNPDILVIELGGDDVIVDGTSIATMITNLNTLISTVVVPNTTGVMVQGIIAEGGGVAVQNPTLMAFNAALQQWAAQNGYPFADVGGAWAGVNGFTQLNPLGYYSTDALHMSTPVGYPDRARVITEALLAA